MKKPKRKTSTALVRRRPTAPVRRPRIVTLQPVPNALPLASLPSDPAMPINFVGVMTLTAEQIAALRRPVQDAEISWRAAKQDGPEIIPYLSHNGYRDRLDAAFGLGGWGMVPVGQPKSMEGGFIYVPFALVIGGLPRAYAWGEQQIHKMTYGDALEGAKSNAIVRCGKELGIARELWDRKYVETLLRRKGTAPADGSTRASSPRAGYNARENEPITQLQRQRLYVIAKKSGRPETEWKMWIATVYKVKSTKDILRKDYEDICTAIEAPAPLPLPEEA